MLHQKEIQNRQIMNRLIVYYVCNYLDDENARVKIYWSRSTMSEFYSQYLKYFDKKKV